MDYHEVHVKPNSINGLPPFTLDKNQVLTINPPKKKTKEFFCCVIQKREKESQQEQANMGLKKSKEKQNG